MFNRSKLKKIIDSISSSLRKGQHLSIFLKKPEYEKIYKSIFKITKYLNKDHIFNERLFHIRNDLFEIPKCKLEGCNYIKEFKYNKYPIYCSQKCLYKEKGNEIKKKQKVTNLKRYGCKDPNQLQWMKDKIIKTNLKIWGVKYTQQNKEIQNKTKETNLKIRGVSCSFSCLKVIEKCKRTNLKKRGVEWVTLCPDILEKGKQTYFKKTGYNNPFENPKVIEKIQYGNREGFLFSFEKILKCMKFELLDKEYINNIYEHNWKCLKCEYVFKENWRNMCRGYRCIKCSRKNNGTSLAEKEIFDFLCNLIGADFILYNCKNIIKNPKTNYFLELDTYIPSLKIAFEYDGLYWHSSEINQNLNSHLEKTNLCKDKGIQLIHIFEDEWIFKKDIVKSRIKQILNINNNLERIYTRKCEIKEITSQEKNEFLNKFHIQGKDNSTIKLGAFYNNKLISVMTFRKENILNRTKFKRGVWELNRFCSDSNFYIPGITGKLLHYFKKNYEWKQIFSYVDQRWNQGNLYFQLGFKLEKITKPNYWYVLGNKRIHRFDLRKKSDEPKDIPEWVLRQKEGYFRIWDCGNQKFILRKENNNDRSSRYSNIKT